MLGRSHDLDRARHRAQAELAIAIHLLPVLAANGFAVRADQLAGDGIQARHARAVRCGHGRPDLRRAQVLSRAGPERRLRRVRAGERIPPRSHAPRPSGQLALVPRAAHHAADPEIREVVRNGLRPEPGRKVAVKPGLGGGLAAVLALAELAALRKGHQPAGAAGSRAVQRHAISGFATCRKAAQVARIRICSPGGRLRSETMLTSQPDIADGVRKMRDGRAGIAQRPVAKSVSSHAVADEYLLGRVE
jgi:hypothetical protein